MEQELTQAGSSSALVHHATLYNTCFDSIISILQGDGAQEVARGNSVYECSFHTKRDLLQRTFLQACSSGNAELVAQLLLPSSTAPDRPPKSSINPVDTVAPATGSAPSSAHFHDPPPATLPSSSSHASRPLVDVNGADESGAPAIILATVFGHGDVVQLLLKAGADVDRPDGKGWTALIWAFQTGNLPLFAFLMNRQASTCIRTNSGISAADLIRKGSANEAFMDLLQARLDAQSHGRTHIQRCDTSSQPSCTSTNPSQPTSTGPSCLSDLVPKGSTSQQKKHDGPGPDLQPGTDSTKSAVGDIEEAFDRLAMITPTVDTFSEDDACTTPQFPRKQDDDGLSTPADLGQVIQDDDLADQEFEWQDCRPDQMLAFSYHDLPALFEISLDGIPSSSATEDSRYLPADILFLAARYASRYGGEDLLGDLMIGALDRIESYVHNGPEDLMHLSFWLANTLLLLHYLRRDPHTAETTIEYQDNLHDLVRSIFVFCIRDAERRLDRILDAALLEHEPLSGFESIRFEGEWRFVKALTGRARKDGLGSIGGSTSSGSGPFGISPSRPSVLSLFGGTDRQPSSALQPGISPPAQEAAPNSPGPAMSIARAPSMPVLRGVSALASAVTSSVSPSQHHEGTPTNVISPRSVTDILSSTLDALQDHNFAGHPCIVVQAFSQLLYWIASEVFNRILAKKRFLCRSRAVQIRLNISAIEDWARTNRLPISLVHRHFKPLNELLQWLQCLSSETSIDSLLCTVDENFSSLNPLQLRKCVRDYRYEVGETKMSEECVQYLSQLQKDWERQRLLLSIDEAERSSTGAFRRQSQVHMSSAYSRSQSFDSLETSSTLSSIHSHDSSRTSDPRTDLERYLDDIFVNDPAGSSVDVRYSRYEPPDRQETYTELLDSRVMLPFALPTSNEALVRYPRNAFGMLQPEQPPRATGSRPSRTPAASGRGSSPHDALPVPSLPDDLLQRLEQAKARYEDPSHRDHFYAEHDDPSTARLSSSMSRHHRGDRYEDLSASVRGDRDAIQQANHWLNWRQRMEEELAEFEAEEAMG